MKKRNINCFWKINCCWKKEILTASKKFRNVNYKVKISETLIAAKILVSDAKILKTFIVDIIFKKHSLLLKF